MTEERISAAARLSDPAVRAFVAEIDAARRPLFDRVDALIVSRFPAVEMRISYAMPTYVNGDSRLYVGVWKHGLSLYGWGSGRDGGFADRHPELLTGRGTIKLTHAAAADITDDDLATLIDAALG